MASEGLYYTLWESKRANIIKAVKEGRGIIALSESDFSLYGNRKSYTFRIEYVDGRPTKRGSSAVARDLQDVLERYGAFHEVMDGKNLVIRMGKSFEVIIESI